MKLNRNELTPVTIRNILDGSPHTNSYLRALDVWVASVLVFWVRTNYNLRNFPNRWIFKKHINLTYGVFSPRRSARVRAIDVATFW